MATPSKSPWAASPALPGVPLGWTLNSFRPRVTSLPRNQHVGRDSGQGTPHKWSTGSHISSSSPQLLPPSLLIHLFDSLATCWPANRSDSRSPWGVSAAVASPRHKAHSLPSFLSLLQGHLLGRPAPLLVLHSHCPYLLRVYSYSYRTVIQVAYLLFIVYCNFQARRAMPDT